MRRLLFTVWLWAGCAMWANAQSVELGGNVKMQKGDNAEWKNPAFDDSNWATVKADGKGLAENSYGWYRIRFVLPKSLLQDNSDVRFCLGNADEVDETYLNGAKIGGMGRMPSDPDGYLSEWDAQRAYDVPADSKLLRWGKENVIAIRVFNGSGDGGLNLSGARIYAPRQTDCLTFSVGGASVKGRNYCAVSFKSTSGKPQKGTLTVVRKALESGKVISSRTGNVTVKAQGSKTVYIPASTTPDARIYVTYRDKPTGETFKGSYVPKYILTPETPEKPQLNNAARFGVRPGSPVIYRIPASGVRPMRFTVGNLPEGVRLNAENGILSGSLKAQGEYVLSIKAGNAKGSDESKLTIVVGDKIGLTPPMGWNSWNCWGLSVSKEKVISSAQAIIDKGLADFGYSYINIDAAWQAGERNADGTISSNAKFPDMKGLGDWLHARGLKFGIYSGPGDLTCGECIGSLDHEKQDAETYNSWGVDYLKYDWCYYSRKFDADGDRTVAAYVRPYLKMEEYLRQQPRDIFYSLCQYGMADVWRWGEFVDANSWRTTGDITDTWSSLYDIGFVRQAGLSPYSGPGHWNDPDMLIVGKVGWSANLRDSRLTVDEQYTHISLWSLLASNMLIGCDVAQMDEFTKRLLCNREVIAVNQDALGRQAEPEVIDGDIQIWKRPLSDGGYAIGIFNVGGKDADVDLSKYLPKLKLSSLKTVRDLWRQKDISTTDLNYYLPTHGVKYIKVTL